MIRRALSVAVILALFVPATGHAKSQLEPPELSGESGSLARKTLKFRPSKRTPLQMTLRTQQSFVAGVPTRVSLTVRFIDVPIWVRIRGKVRKLRAFKLFNRMHVRPSLIASVASCRPLGGALTLYDPKCAPEGNGYPLGFKTIDLPNPGDRFKRIRFDVSTDYAFDMSFDRNAAHAVWLRRGRAQHWETVVTYPRCITPDTSGLYGALPRFPGSPCQPADLKIGTAYTLAGRTWRGSGSEAFRTEGGQSRRSVTIFPPASNAP